MLVVYVFGWSVGWLVLFGYFGFFFVGVLLKQRFREPTTEVWGSNNRYFGGQHRRKSGFGEMLGPGPLQGRFRRKVKLFFY